MVTVLEAAAGVPLARAAILQRLVEGGVPKEQAGRAWDAVRRRLKGHDQVVVDGSRYRWSRDGRRDLSAFEAVDLLVAGGLREARREALADVIRAALGDEQERAVRRRHADIASVRALAELASEVEELIVNETDAKALIHRVRARAARSNLEPIANSGEELPFDRQRHKPIGGGIHDGATVVVVRPGYVWRSPTGDVLVADVLVEE